jgi:hypothetical protein
VTFSILLVLIVTGILIYFVVIPLYHNLFDEEETSEKLRERLEELYNKKKLLAELNRTNEVVGDLVDYSAKVNKLNEEIVEKENKLKTLNESGGYES